MAEAQPQWAREGLGPVPADPVERLGWEQRAGQVAAYREMAGHADDATPLGPAPKAGKVEHHAAWHAAWRALGRPESGREEAGMSDGQLLVRVRAYQREEAWAPAYVADELDGTSREAVRQRQDATLLTARAERAPAGERAELHRRAAETAAYADVLDARVRDLGQADDVRARWYVHTAETRSAADRARAELADRAIDPDRPADAVSPQEWLAAHRAHMRVEDRHRQITDFADDRELAVAEVEPVPVDAVETEVRDIREAAVPAPTSAEEGRGRVATADETAAAVERAQRALLELRARTATERARAEEESWHIERGQDARRDQVAEAVVGAELVDG